MTLIMAGNDQDCSKNMASSFDNTGIPSTQNQSSAVESKVVINLDGPEDEDPIALCKDDPNDDQNSRQTRLRTSQSKSVYDKMSKPALIGSITRRDNEIAELKKKKSEANKEAQKEKTNRVQMQKENRRLEKQIVDLKAETQRSQKEKVKLQDTFIADLKEAKQQYADAQEAWIAKVNESIYHSLPDDVIRDKFRELWASCRGWVREWYQKQTSERSMQFFENIAGQCASDLRGSADSVLAEKLNSGNPTVLRVLGFAWLSREMIKYFFESPFFGIGKYRRTLENFYQYIMQGE